MAISSPQLQVNGNENNGVILDVQGLTKVFGSGTTRCLGPVPPLLRPSGE